MHTGYFADFNYGLDWKGCAGGGGGPVGGGGGGGGGGARGGGGGGGGGAQKFVKFQVTKIQNH